MDIAESLTIEHSKRMSMKIAAWIGTDRRRIRKLMQLFLSGERIVAQRSAMAVDILATEHPDLLRPYLHTMVKRMIEPDVHDAVRRCVLRMLQHIKIPSRLLGPVTCACFEFLSDHQSPTAIKAFAMSTLAGIAQKEPDLKEELRLVIQQQLPYASAGFRSRAKQVLPSYGDPPFASGTSAPCRERRDRP